MVKICLNPLLSEAVFSMGGRMLADEVLLGSLNPLLSEAVFSMSRSLRPSSVSRRSLNPLLSEAVFSMGRGYCGAGWPPSS